MKEGKRKHYENVTSMGDLYQNTGRKEHEK